MNVLLVEDHAATRDEMNALIGGQPDLLVSQAGSAEEAIAIAKQAEFDVVVMDIALPGMNGVEATRRILSDHPNTKVLALSNFSGAALVQAVLAAGGRGYVHKNRAFEELIPAIRAVVAGNRYLGTDADQH